MKPEKKGELIGTVIGFLCIYIFFGAIYHFVSGYDFISTVRLLATMTFLLLIVGIPVIALTWFLFFVTSKIKR